MAMSITRGTSSSGRTPENASIERVQIAWVADANGTASDTVNLVGQILELITVPGISTEKPTTLYDVELLDITDTGVDYLNDTGMNRSASDIEFVEPIVGTYNSCCVSGDVSFRVLNAGDSNTGKAIFFLKT